MMTTTPELRIVNWNANGIRTRTDELLLLTDRVRADIVILTETHLAPSVTISTPGFTCYRKDRPLEVQPGRRRRAKAAGGVAILVRESLRHHEFVLPATSDLFESVAIRLSLNGSLHTIIAAYCPRTNHDLSKDLSAVMAAGNHVVLAGDLNCRHRRLDSPGSNRNGVLLVRFQDERDVECHLPDLPTHHSGTLSSKLDIALTKNVRNVSILRTLQNLSSDHLPVIFTIGGPYEEITQQHRFDVSQAHWPGFKEYINSILDLNMSTFKTKADVDEAISLLTTHINGAKELNIPIEEPHRPHRVKLPGEIVDLIKERNALRRLWQRTRDRQTKMIVNSMTAFINMTVQELKAEGWRRKLASLEFSDGTLWRMAKSLRRQRNVIPPLRGAGGIAYSDDDKADALAEGFATSHALTSNMHDARTEKTVQDSLDAIAAGVRNIQSVTLVRPSEVQRIIAKMPSRKAPGPDSISNTLLKHLPARAIVYLAKIFNACLLLGYFPAQWKCPNVIPIFKPGKDKVLPVSYRPISLLNGLSKVLEKVILKRYTPFQRFAIQNEQFGFRPDHSTAKQLVRLADHVTKGFNMSKRTGMVLLDIEKAFDTVWHDGLIHKLHATGVPLYIIDILRSYLSDRQFIVCVSDGRSTARPVPAGVPQGSVLAPQLFSHFISDLPVPRKCDIALYADDTACYTSGRVPSHITNALQNALGEITTFYTKWKIKVNDAKTEAIIFDHRPNRPHPQTRLTCGRTNIEWSDKVKYLGVHLDRGLGWAPHIQAARAKGYIGKSGLYPLLGAKSPLCINDKVRLYRAIINPFMMYASPVWSNASPNVLKQLQSVQYQCLRLIYGTPQKYSSTKLHKRAHQATIQDQMLKATSRLYASIKVSKNPLLKGIGTDTPDSLSVHYRHKFIHHILLGENTSVSDGTRGSFFG